jgi:hypothetical protein
MMLSDQDIDRIAAAVVAKLAEQAMQTIDIHREVRMSAEQRKALSRERVQRAKGAA